MIKHIVIWMLKDQAKGNDKAKNARIIKEKLEALNGRIQGMVKLEVGFDFSRAEGSGDLALYSEFTSREALKRYLVHPEHEAVKNFIGGVRESRQVVDYEV